MNGDACSTTPKVREIVCMNNDCSLRKENKCAVFSYIPDPCDCEEYVSIEAYIMKKIEDHERRLLMLEAKHV